MFIPKFSRRQFLKCLGISGGVVLLNPFSSFQGQASTGPCPHVAGKKIRWIVPYSTGGGFDIYSRLIAPFFGKRIGARISVENVLGGGGIIGAYEIANADPNGLTLGMVNSPGLLAASLTGETKAPNPAKDFAILGRVARSRQVWVTGKNSPFETMEEVFIEAQKRPILFSISEVGGANFINVAVITSLLVIPLEYLAGFSGSRESALAVIRGDADITSLPFESGLAGIESGDIRPILQVSSERISPHLALEDVCLLGGERGLASRRAMSMGRDVEETRADAEALIALISSGRHVVAPPGIEESLFRCLEHALYQTLTNPAFVKAAAAAKRSLDVARGAKAHADVLAAVGKAEKLTPIVRAAIEQVRS